MSRVAQFALFFGIVLAVLGGIHWVLWARLVRDTGMAQPWRGRMTWAIVGLALYLPLGQIVGRQLAAPWGDLVRWPGFLWSGVMFILFVTVVGGWVIELLARGGARLWATPLDAERRLLFSRTAGAVAAAATAGLSAWAVRSALRGPRLVEHEITLAKLPRGADGLTIVQLTDIHVGPTVGRDYLASVVARVNALSPDIIAITGDLVDGPLDELRDAVAPLAELRARHGVYFVTGNHEYYAGAHTWVKHLTSLGVRVLRNERVTIGAGEAAFDLAGIDDWWAVGDGHRADLPRALAGRDPSRALVLLAHQPRAVLEAARLGVDLQLSGHTHEGQIWPFKYFVYLQQPYVAGLVKHDSTWLYVSPGTGYYGPPMRLFAPSEITRITLRAGA